MSELSLESQGGKTSVVDGIVQSDVQLHGKVVIITGANTGIGYETALSLARRGAKVIMACRDLSKAQKAHFKISEDASPADVEVMMLNLASLASVRAFAEQFLDKYDRLDILINNAGVMMCPPLKTEDGYEMQLGVNHIGHFLLTNLLLDILKKTAPSRIVIVSSIAHRKGRWNWDDVMHEKEYGAFNAYRVSKLANIMHCLELSKRLQGTGVTCNVLHPGVIKTELGRHIEEGSHFPFYVKATLTVFWPIVRLFLITPEKGAQTTIYCAIAPELENVSGKYFANCAEVDLQPHAKNDEDTKKLWQLSEEWTRQKS